MNRSTCPLLVASIVAGFAGTARGQAPPMPPATPPSLTSETVVLLPDTQYYSNFDPATFRAQTHWIADNHDPSQIKMVIHLGDITDENEDFEWDRALAAMNILRTPLDFPYVVVSGNHDNPDHGSRRDTTKFNQHFGVANFAGKEWWKSLDGTGDNSVATFTAGGREFMVVNLEYAPRKQKLCLASDEIARNPTKAVIIATHCYQSANGGWRDCITSKNLIGSNGQTIWEELARRHNNVQMIVSGHITSSAHTQRSFATGQQGSGGEVHEILSDFQFVRQASFLPLLGPKHGMGWMRTLSFDAVSNDVTINTFSVLDPTAAATQLAWYMTLEASPGDFPNWEEHWNQTFPLPRTFPTMTPGDLLNVHDFNVNEGANGDQVRPRIAGNGTGAFTVVWGDDLNKNGVLQVKGRGFRPDGCQQVAQQTINAVAAGQQDRPAVAVGADGSTVVVWEDDQDDNGFYQILAAGFDADGNRRFGDIEVNQVADGQQLRPDVEMDSQGNFVVVWQDDSNSNGVYEIKAARFDALGQRRSPDLTVNSGASGNQLAPRIGMRRNPASAEDGAFVVVWEDDLNENGVFQIKAARYSPDGNRLLWPGQGATLDRTVNQFPDGQQRQPAIAFHRGGDFVVVWQDDRNENGVFQIKMAGFDVAGNKKFWGPNGEEDRTVNMFPAGDQLRPQISMNTLGNFAVVWQDDLNENGQFQIKAAGFNLTGTRIADDVTVNFSPNGQQIAPDVLLRDNNQVFVVWQDDVNVNGFNEIVSKAFVLGQPVEPPAPPEESPQPLFAEMDVPPWFATQGAIEADAGRRTAGNASIAFAPGFTEARPPGFATGAFPAIGSKLLVDVFVPAEQPASNYKGAVQLYWGVPGAGYNHQFVGQKELSPLAGGAWHVLEFDLPEVMRRLFLESHHNAELRFAVNTQADAPARTLLDNLRFGGVLVPHSQSECDSVACLSVCGPGKADCDGSALNGCETYLATSRGNCGACGNSCGQGVCVNSACEPAGARNISASISIQSQWETGYCAAVSFTNQSLAPVVWEVVLDLKGATITSSWNGTFSGAQGVVGVSGAGWNNVIQPGASLDSLGFCAQRAAGGSTAAVVRTNTQFQ